jgi:hypothetical protein
MNRPTPITIVLALLLLTCTGCNRITFGYDHADWLLRHWINDYTTFDAEQKDEINADVAAYMRWHRKHALPEYIAFLQHLETLAERDSPLNLAEIKDTRAEISRLYRFTMKPFIRPAAHLLSTLDDRQIEELRRTLSKQNHEQREEILSGNKREDLVKRADGYVRFVEELAGHLTADQESRIREMSTRIPFVTEYYLEHREAMQVKLILLLRQHAGEDSIAALLSQWVDAPPAPASAHEREDLDAYDTAMNEMIAGISGMLTEQQRIHLRKTIADHIEDFQHLHAETRPHSTAQKTPPIATHDAKR